jgi:hypothetical protein
VLHVLGCALWAKAGSLRKIPVVALRVAAILFPPVNFVEVLRMRCNTDKLRNARWNLQFLYQIREIAIRAIALVENDSIRGLNKSHIYFVERLESSLDRLRKDRNTNWRVKATAYTRQGISMRGFPARLEGEEGEKQFWFEGGSDADKRVRVEIQGAWLQNLPWQRAA